MITPRCTCPIETLPRPDGAPHAATCPVQPAPAACTCGHVPEIHLSSAGAGFAASGCRCIAVQLAPPCTCPPTGAPGHLAGCPAITDAITPQETPRG